MKLVSAILPTRGRSEWAKRAVDVFLSQTYPEKELIVLDDQNERSFPDGAQSLPAGHRILYFLSSSRSIPEKRNVACSYARGEFIFHVDSDDWSSPERMAEQVKLLEESGKSLVGYHSMLFYDERTAQAYAYRYAAPGKYAIGSSMAYRRSWWQHYPFRILDGKPWGEDNNAVQMANRQGEIISVEGCDRMVARIHDGSTSIHDFKGMGYYPIDRTTIPQEFFA